MDSRCPRPTMVYAQTVTRIAAIQHRPVSFVFVRSMDFALALRDADRKKSRLQPASQLYCSPLFLSNSSIVKARLTTANPLWALPSAARSMRRTRAFPLSRTVGVEP